MGPIPSKPSVQRTVTVQRGLPVSSKKSWSEALQFFLLILFASIATPFLTGNFHGGTGTLWAVAVIVLGSAPMFLMLWRREWRSVPLLELNGLYYVVAFGIPGLLEKGHLIVPREEVDWALELTVAGLLALYVGYFWVGRALLGKVRPIRMPAFEKGTSLLMVGLGLEAFYLVYSYSAAKLGFHVPSVDQFVPLLGGVGKVLILFFAISLRPPSFALKRFAMAAGGSLLLLDGLFNLSSGLLFQVFPLLIIFVLCWRQFRGTFPRIAILLAVMALIILNTGKAKYREVYWGEGPSNASPLRQVGDLVQFSLENAGKGGKQIGENVESVFLRLDAVTLFARVLETTPQVIPYAHGATLESAFYVWIPRLIWPSKPRAVLGNEWGHQYGLLDPGDDVTSLNLPWIVEFYMNFGWLGVCVLMVAVGVIYRFLLSLLMPPGGGLLHFAIAAAVANNLWFAESNFVLMWGTVFQGILALAIMLRLFVPRDFIAHRGHGQARFHNRPNVID